MKVGASLLEIRDARLYRPAYNTFEDYCRERWNISRSRAHRLIEAASVTDNLLPMGNIPENERQVRELAPFEKQVQQAVWKLTTETADTNDEGKPIVTAARRKLKEKARRP